MSPRNINFEPSIEPFAPPLPPPPYHLFLKKDVATGLITPGEAVMSKAEKVVAKEKKRKGGSDY